MKFEGQEDDETNLYNEDTREELIDDDEITAEEEGFMKGYNEEENICSNCGSMVEADSKVEREIEGKNMTFCSEECADSFEE